MAVAAALVSAAVAQAAAVGDRLRKLEWVKRKSGVFPVVGFCRRPQNPIFTLDQKFCRAGLLGQMGPIENYREAFIICKGGLAISRELLV